MELLVALTILIIAIIPIALFFGKMLRNIEQASIRTRAIMLAEERVAEILNYPYTMLRSNNSPNKADIINPPANITALWGVGTPIDLTDGNYYFEPGPPYRTYQYFFTLPTEFNPYDPRTQGWNNSLGINHYDPAGLEFEYEPIGFMARLSVSADVATTDPRRSLVIDAPDLGLGGFVPRSGGVVETPRTGSAEREELYHLYGRRTVLLEVLPEPRDDDDDQFPSDSEFDGGATIYDPYPVLRGPANKFLKRSTSGDHGFWGWVTVFWLPANAPQNYIPLEELRYVQIPFFISATNAESILTIDDRSVNLSNKFIIN